MGNNTLTNNENSAVIGSSVSVSERLNLNNQHSQWVDNSKVKIGRCKKCKGLQSCGWLFPDMAWYREFCFGCNDFSKFIVQPSLKYVPPVGSENGYVTGGVSFACS